MGTIWATIRSAGREIKASQAQTSVAQKQIDTTVRLEKMREANEASAFRAMLEAAMTQILAEVAWAKKTYPKTFTQTTEVVSIEAGAVRQCITKSAFAELRAACLKQGSPLTGEFLSLEGEIHNFAIASGDLRLLGGGGHTGPKRHACRSGRTTYLDRNHGDRTAPEGRARPIWLGVAGQGRTRRDF